MIQISQSLKFHDSIKEPIFALNQMKSTQETISKRYQRVFLVCIIPYYTQNVAFTFETTCSIHVGTCTSSYGANSNHTHKVPVIPSCQGLACWITATISGLSVITICQSNVRSCKRLQVTLTNETIGQHVHFYPKEP